MSAYEQVMNPTTGQVAYRKCSSCGCAWVRFQHEDCPDCVGWPVQIELPAEPERDRILEARRPGGDVAWTWRYIPERYGWVRAGLVCDYVCSWPQIVEACIDRWQLWTCPPTGDGGDE